MKLSEIFSCYTSRSYTGKRAAFEAILRYFETPNRYYEDAWEKVSDFGTKVVFRKGASIVLTFDYSSPAIEVKATVEFFRADNLITLSVGNWGFPFEPLLSKPRYLALLEKINNYIVDNEIDVQPKLS